ncbi:MAG: hypothetical protein KME35_07480 [Aphanocapsa sp. GSE-SYN-MK-11-07L]|nr:hypothetical protein [Aphanocapsa sp. GSE-SYN-MK-11-07L]
MPSPRLLAFCPVLRNATSTHNPFAAATQAAIAELTSAQAQRFYALQGQKDTQNALEAMLTVVGWVYQLSEIAYNSEDIWKLV